MRARLVSEGGCPVVRRTQEGIEELSETVKEALGELAGAAKEGLMALSVGVGLGVLAELMEAEVEQVVGPKGKHDPERRAKRHGHESASVTLGARRVAVSRPCVRSAEEERELPLATSRHFAARDALTDVVLERMLAGVSTRRFRRTQEPVGQEIERSERSTSKSAVSRSFVARTAETLAALMSRRLDDVRLAVLMLDGIELKARTNVVALGITTEGQKVPLGLWEGSTENAAVAVCLRCALALNASGCRGLLLHHVYRLDRPVGRAAIPARSGFGRSLLVLRTRASNSQAPPLPSRSRTRRTLPMCQRPTRGVATPSALSRSAIPASVRPERRSCTITATVDAASGSATTRASRPSPSTRWPKGTVGPPM